jgi:formylglycine-generating enzyme required for sulfatase activity
MAFCFDNESPRHTIYLEAFQIGNRNITCREYLDFMSDDGYTSSRFWLSDGWETAKQADWEAPLYWERDPSDVTGWHVFTLRGPHGLSALLDTPRMPCKFLRSRCIRALAWLQTPHRGRMGIRC